MQIFCPPRCLLCIDGAGSMADICFADDWPKEKYMPNDAGRSLIITRSKLAENIVHDSIKADVVCLSQHKKQGVDKERSSDDL